MSDDDDLSPARPVWTDLTPLGRIMGRDAEKYARAWGIDLDDELGRKLYDLETRFMSVAHSDAEDRALTKIDYEAFALAWRPEPLSEILRWLAEDEKRRRAAARSHLRTV